MSVNRAAAHAGERGLGLMEMVVVVGILVVIAGTAYEALAQHPAQVHSTAITFSQLVAEARSLASVTSDGTLGGGSGASIGVVREGAEYVATLYAYRPIAGALYSPSRQPNTPALRTLTAINMATASGGARPPFALFFSTSGHASAQRGFTIGVSAPLATEPGCPIQTGIEIEFSDATQTQVRAITCEMAQLTDVQRATTAPVSALTQRAP